MMSYTQISITLPVDVLKATDARAKELDRARSWVIADVLRGYLGIAPAGSRGAPQKVSEPAPAVYVAAEVASARRRHLVAEAALPQAERLRRAEELGRLARDAQRRGGRGSPRSQVIGFDSYEDYYEWKKGRLVGR